MKSRALAKSMTLIGLLVVLLLTTKTSAQLSSNFYATSCPSALVTIKVAVLAAVIKEPRMGASLLRLHFHDCFVNGCDASVLLDDTATFTGEKNAPPNINSLRGFDVVDNIKTALEILCPGIVSCADILAVAARDSVVALGGPSWNVVLGRRDSTTASFSAVTQNLIPPTADLADLISGFANKGFSANELVALYGAHTFGQAKCNTFRSRIYNETNIDPTFAATRQANCPLSGGDENLAPLDAITPILFDRGWFIGLMNQKGLLHSDQQLFNGGSTDAQVSAYATNLGLFKNDFANGMIKMGNLSPLTGTSGQVRANCRRIK